MIDEKKLIETIRREGILGCGHSDFERVEYVIDMIEQQEVIEKWIPCSERLPEDYENVLVWFEYFMYGDFNRPYQTYGFDYVYNGEWSPFVNLGSGWKDLKILAWMPLPKPYKGE